MLQKYNTPAKNATPIYGGIGNFLLPKHHIYLLKCFKKQKKLPQRVLRERCLKKDDGLEHSLNLSLELLL